MNKSAIPIIAVAIAVACVFTVTVLFAVSNQKDGGSGKIKAVVTIAPQKEFVSKVAGEHVLVTVMVPSGKEPHSYEPTAEQMKAVADADVYFKLGSGIEFESIWMDTFVQQNPKMKVVNCSSGITLIPMEHEHDHNDSDSGCGPVLLNGTRTTVCIHDYDHHEEHGLDPHVWMSPKNAKIMVENILKTLKSMDSENAGIYQKNADAYMLELDNIIANMTAGLSPYKGSKILVYHPAFGYLAHDFGLVQIAVEKNGMEPTPSGLAAVIEQAKKENITVVFAEPQFDRHNADVIASEIGGTVIMIDALAEHYADNMKDIAVKLISALGKT